MTPLARRLRELIACEGPISFERYMALALSDPDHGYYMTRDPLGEAGDFVTAPEISQMFGELLGVWAADLWRRMGAPDPVRLIELGPGRGTLMKDALRAARACPGFLQACDVHLVEISPALAERQRRTLAGAAPAIAWSASIEAVPEGPAIIFANEFFDALPVRHYVRLERGWSERLVGTDETGAFAFGAAGEPEPGIVAEAPRGAVIELGAEARLFAERIARRLQAQGGALLILDYGYERPRFGETLQAVRRHARADILADPGEVDLTAHVDFYALARAAGAAGARVFGPIEQGTFLRRLGIEERAARLKQGASADQIRSIEDALARLVDPNRPDRPGMGELFKVLAVTAPDCPAPAGFEEANA